MNMLGKQSVSEQVLEAVKALGSQFTEYAASTQGLHLNDVTFAGEVQLDNTGVYTVRARVAGAAITVWNPSSSHVLITNGGPGQPGITGAGQLELGAGAWGTFPVAGNAYTIYGRPNTRVSVAVHTRALDPAGGSLGDAPWHKVNAGAAGVAANGVVYTHPWFASGLMPIYGGFSLIETTNAAAAEFRVWDFAPPVGAPTTPPTFSTAGAAYLGGLIVGQGGSVDLELSGGLRANSGSIFLELVSGALSGIIRVR